MWIACQISNDYTFDEAQKSGTSEQKHNDFDECDTGVDRNLFPNDLDDGNIGKHQPSNVLNSAS